MRSKLHTRKTWVTAICSRLPFKITLSDARYLIPIS
jgi:hypothetical protein